MKMFGMSDEMLLVTKPTKGIKSIGSLSKRYGNTAVYIPEYESVNDFKEDTLDITDVFVFPDGTETFVNLFIWKDENGQKQGVVGDLSEPEANVYILDIKIKLFGKKE